MLSVTQSAFCTACKCMQRLSAIVFRSNYPGDSPVPLTLPPRRFTFLPVKTRRSRCCFLPGFQHSVTSTGFSTLQKLPPAFLSIHSPPAAPRSLLGGVASDVKLGEAGVNARLRGATTIRLLFPPLLHFSAPTLLILQPETQPLSNLLASYRSELIAFGLSCPVNICEALSIPLATGCCL